MFSFLDGFEKRMEMVGVVESIVNRRNRNMELERLFTEEAFINLIFTVLLYIMEKTLSEDSDCDSEHILKFLESVLPEYYGLHLDRNQMSSLTSYIIKNVLQNEGVSYHFQSIDYSASSKRDIIIRLITDHVLEVDGDYRIIYSLTDQGYDFLFRTKEVDQEIKMTIEELKLRELIKRKNFRKAHDQSLNLIQIVRQKKREIQVFLMKIKENIHDVDINEYEKLMSSIYSLLDEEYDLLNKIMEMSQKSEDKIRQEYEMSQKLDGSLKKAQREIRQINKNIKIILSEQKDLILNRQSLSKVYIDTLGDSFEYSLENRYDLEDVILKQMEKHVEWTERFWQIVNPLFMPNVYKNMNVRSIFEPQGMIKLEEEEKVNFIEDEDLSEDYEKEKIERINYTYVDILDYILQAALKKNGECTAEDMVYTLRTDSSCWDKFMEDRIFFMTLLKLYDIGSIDIGRWKESENKVVMNLSEEFNLEYCLYQLMDQREYIHSIEKITFWKRDHDLIEVEVHKGNQNGLNVIEKIQISNFTVRVKMSDEQRKNRDTNL